MKTTIEEIPISQIRILNPRARDPKKFAIVVESIRDLGLKKPIKVSRRNSRKPDEPLYDLVYGQGRLEAFKALGRDSIPALVVDISREDRLLSSLVENMARRFPDPGDLIAEIQRLHDTGISNREIGKRLGIADGAIAGYLALADAGEERLLKAALAGKIPLGVARDIAQVNDLDAQRAFLKAYQSGDMKQGSIRVVKKLIEQRRHFGKSVSHSNSKRVRASAESFVAAYRKITQKQKAAISRAKHCENRLMFIVTALKKFLEDENFRNLLRAEKIDSIPEFLARKIDAPLREAA